MDIQQQIKELREKLDKLEQQQCCHDWEVFACGCKKCKKCGLIIRDYYGCATIDFGNITTYTNMGSAGLNQRGWCGNTWWT